MVGLGIIGRTGKAGFVIQFWEQSKQEATEGMILEIPGEHYTTVVSTDDAKSPMLNLDNHHPECGSDPFNVPEI